MLGGRDSGCSGVWGRAGREEVAGGGLGGGVADAEGSGTGSLLQLSQHAPVGAASTEHIVVQRELQIRTFSCP